MILVLTTILPHVTANDDVEACLSVIGEMGVRIGQSEDLGADGGLALDTFMEADDLAVLRPIVSGLLASKAVDFCLQPATDRRKRLLIADMDSTIINVECIDELADFAGVKAQVSEITERAMRGELDFEAALRERVAMLKGLPLADLQRAYDERVQLNPGARTLVRTMTAHGAKAFLVSGGFSFFTRRVAEAAGFNANRANTLIEDGDLLAGTVGEPILGREAKLAALQKKPRTCKYPCRPRWPSATAPTTWP